MPRLAVEERSSDGGDGDVRGSGHQGKIENLNIFDLIKYFQGAEDGRVEHHGPPGQALHHAGHRSAGRALPCCGAEDDQIVR